ncbi:MAG: anticodon nuclease [Paludibacter sp.]|nr:anticodon nuclease [Paludibacter sp.]
MDISSLKKDIFKRDILNKLNKKEFQDFKKTIQNNYRFDNYEDIYILKEGLDENTFNYIVHILKTIGFLSFESLDEIAAHIRELNKKYTLLYAYNGVGKTRLSTAFKNIGKQSGGADTLYYNAFTEDLFSWDNDLEYDTERKLKINLDSQFFIGLPGLDISNKIRPILRKFATFNFDINFELGEVYFEREILVDGHSQIIKNIKVSRGEENIFIWCFFSAVAQLVMDGENRYNWVNYIYIDDPISSLDDNNAIAVAHHLALMLKGENSNVKTIISTHHSLFYNVLCNEFKNNSTKLFLRRIQNAYDLKDTTDTPFVYHVFMIQEIQKAINEDRLVNYHFTLLRNLLEKTANFHGFNGFENLIVINEDDEDKTLYHRYIQIFNHGGYSLFEPAQLSHDNKDRFVEIFENFKNNYKFNNDLFPASEA